MASKNKTYFLAPSWDVQPAEVILGSIVANFNDPRQILSSSNLPDLIDRPIIAPPPSRLTGTAKKGAKWQAGLFAKFMHFISVGGGVDVSSSSASEINFSCEEMGTQRFQPSLEYVIAAIQDPGVASHLQMGGLRAKVFMITGIKTARTITITTRETSDLAIKGHLGMDIPLAETTVGPKASWKPTTSEEYTQTIVGPIVFAFEVEKIKLTPKGGVKHGRLVDGAMLGMEGGTFEYSFETAGGDLDEDELGDFGVAIIEDIDEREGDFSVVVPV